jgi:hypothetical protein
MVRDRSISCRWPQAGALTFLVSLRLSDPVPLPWISHWPAGPGHAMIEIAITDEYRSYAGLLPADISGYRFKYPCRPSDRRQSALVAYAEWAGSQSRFAA